MLVLVLVVVVAVVVFAQVPHITGHSFSMAVPMMASEHVLAKLADA